MSAQSVKEELANNFENSLDAVLSFEKADSSEISRCLLSVAAVKGSLTTLLLQNQNPKALAELQKLQQQFQTIIKDSEAEKLGPIFKQLLDLDRYLQKGDEFRVSFLELVLNYSTMLQPNIDANVAVRQALLEMLSHRSFEAKTDLNKIIQFVANWNELILSPNTAQPDYVIHFLSGLDNFNDNTKLWQHLLEAYKSSYIKDSNSNQELEFKLKASRLKAQQNPFLTPAVRMMELEYEHPSSSEETQAKLFNDLGIIEQRCRPNAKADVIEKFDGIVDAYVGCSSRFLRGAGIALVMLGLFLMSVTLAVVAWHVLPLTALPFFMAQHVLPVSIATFSGGAMMSVAGAFLYHHNYVYEKGVCMLELQNNLDSSNKGPQRGH